jgi:hypothetical protein
MFKITAQAECPKTVLSLKSHQLPVVKNLGKIAAFQGSEKFFQSLWISLASGSVLC